MAINSINTVTAAAAASTQTTTKSAEKTSETIEKGSFFKTASGVIYEKSSDSRTDKAFPIKQQARPTTQRSLQS